MSRSGDGIIVPEDGLGDRQQRFECFLLKIISGKEKKLAWLLR